MLTNSWMAFAQGLAVVWRWRCISEKGGKTTSVGFQPLTSFVRLWQVKHWANQSVLTGIWSPDLFCLFINDRSLHWKQVNFDHPPTNQVNFAAHTETKWFSAGIQNQASFDHPHKNQVSRSPNKIQVIFGPNTKPNRFRSIHWNQAFSATTQNKVNFDLRTKNKSIWRHTETKQNYTPHTKTALIEIPSLTSSQSRPLL